MFNWLRKNRPIEIIDYDSSGNFLPKKEFKPINETIKNNETNRFHRLHKKHNGNKTKFHRLVDKFKHQHKRNPNKHELFMIVVDASHKITRRKGKKGHLIRQKIRQGLLRKHNINKHYRIR